MLYAGPLYFVLKYLICQRYVSGAVQTVTGNTLSSKGLLSKNQRIESSRLLSYIYDNTQNHQTLSTI